MRSLLVILGLSSGFLSGCGPENAPVEKAPAARPVTVFELIESLPDNPNQLAGSVSAWKTEEIGFEVGGRIERVLEPGTEVLGRTRDELGRELTAGTEIATLDTQRFELQLESAKAQHRTAVSQRDAKQTELNEVVPARLSAAKASADLGKAELARVQQLFDRKVSTQAELDRADASYRKSDAEYQLAKANQGITEAELASLNAQVEQALEAVETAQRDLRDTKLFSAYHGQIAEVHQIPGSFVQPGQAVVTVQMMDPIAVEVSVSSETDSRLNYNDTVRVFLPEIEAPIDGMIYEKAAVADAATRTFNVTLLVRNDQLEVGLPTDVEPAEIVRVRSLWRVYSESNRREPPYFVQVKSIHQDDDGAYVWRVRNRNVQQGISSQDARLELEQVRITLGERRIPFLQIATLREVTDLGELDPSEDLIAGQFVNARDELLEGPQQADDSGAGLAYHIRKRWKLRPGEIVRVDLSRTTPVRGFYVPTDVIISRLDEHAIFRVRDDQAERVAVRVHEMIGTRRRITPVTEGELSAGDLIVSEGALFLADQERVNVVDRQEARP